MFRFLKRLFSIDYIEKIAQLEGQLAAIKLERDALREALADKTTELKHVSDWVFQGFGAPPLWSKREDPIISSAGPETPKVPPSPEDALRGVRRAKDWVAIAEELENKSTTQTL